MPVALIIIGTILIVVAFQNTMGQLAKELMADIPGFFVWAIAIAAILGLGYVPGLKTPSRWLLGLVVLVLVLTNYKQILQGFQQFAQSGGKPTGADAPDPATAYGSSPSAPLPTAAQVSGEAGSGPAAQGASQAGAGMMGGILGNLGSLVGSVAGTGSQAAGTILNFNPASLATSIGFGGTL